MEVWYLQLGAQRKGPYSSEGLREALRLGDVDPFCDVFHSSNPNLVKPLLEWDEVFDSSLPMPQAQQVLQTQQALKSQQALTERPLQSQPNEPSQKILQVLGSTVQSEKNGLRRSDNLIHQTIETLHVSLGDQSAPEYTFLSDSKRKESKEKEQAERTSKKTNEVRLNVSSDKDRPQNPSSPAASNRNAKTQSPAQPSKDSRDSHSRIDPGAKNTLKRKRKTTYIVQQGSQTYGPFTSLEVLEHYKNGNIKRGAVVGKGSLAKTAPIERFVEVYQSGKKSSFFPDESGLKWLTKPRLTGALWASAIALIAVIFAYPYLGPLGKNPKGIAKTRPQTTEVAPNEVQKPLLNEPTTNPSITSNPTETPIETNLKNTKRRPNQNRLSVNSKSTISSRMSARSIPRMVKVAGPSTIAQALMGKNDGAEVTITGLEFDRAAVRNCRGMCEVMFIDTSGAAIQVAFNGASHRNSLFSKSGRVSIVGFLTAGKLKIILKKAY